MRWPAAGADPAPDPALTRAFAAALPGGRLAGPLVAFAEVPSTQVLGRAWAGAGAPEGAVVLADHQTAGRGRLGRRWVAPPGTSLLFSCVLRPPWPAARWPELTLLAGCAVAEAVETGAGLPARLRWPNDVLVRGRKVAGILAEGVVGVDSCVLLGVGLNVGQREEDWPAELAPRAASLAQLGARVAREALLGAILGRLAARYEELLEAGFAPVRAAWRARAILGGAVHTAGGPATALDLAPDGRLLVRRADGSLDTVVSGGEPAAPAAAAAR